MDFKKLAFLVIIFLLVFAACDDGGGDDPEKTMEILRPRPGALTYLEMDVLVSTDPSADSISVYIDNTHIFSAWMVDSITSVDISALEPGDHTLKVDGFWSGEKQTATTTFAVFDSDMPAPTEVIVGGEVIDEMYVMRNADDHVTGLFLDAATGPSTADFSGLENYPLLQMVSITGYSAETVDFFPLSSLNFMENLSIVIDGLTEFDWTVLDNMTSLSNLSIHSGSFEECNLEAVALVATVIDLSGNGIVTVVWPDRVRNLVRINLSDNNIEYIYLIPLQTTYTLQELNLSGNNLYEASIPAIPYIRRIDLSDNNLQELNILNLSSITSLEYFNIAGNQLTSLNLNPLRYHSGLTELYAGGNPAQTVDLAFLSDLTNLEILSFVDGSLESIDLTGLENNTHFKELRLASNNLTSINLWSLADCDNIEVIDVSMNALPTINLSPLWNLNMLNQVYLQDNDLTEITLNTLSSCESMRVLNLSSNLLTEIDLAPVSSMYDLVLLDLRNNTLTEETCELISLFLIGHPSLTIRSDCD